MAPEAPEGIEAGSGGYVFVKKARAAGKPSE
jgi:hypothetical protein